MFNEFLISTNVLRLLTDVDLEYSKANTHDAESAGTVFGDYTWVSAELASFSATVNYLSRSSSSASSSLVGAFSEGNTLTSLGDTERHASAGGVTGRADSSSETREIALKILNK